MVRDFNEFAHNSHDSLKQLDEDTLEQVQRRAVRNMTDLKGTTYEKKLQEAGLMLLKERRWRGDMIEVYKIVSGLTNVDKDKWFEFMPEERINTRRNVWIDSEGSQHPRSHVIMPSRARTELRRNFFTCRVTSEWNNLPEDIKAAESLNAFKNRIDRLITQRSHRG